MRKWTDWIGLFLILILSMVGCAQPSRITPEPQVTEALSGPSLEDQLDRLALSFARQASVRGKQRIAVSSFTDVAGKETRFGMFVAEKLTTRLHQTAKFDLIERKLLKKIIADHQLSLVGIVDPESAKELGKILGVEGIVTGTTVDMGSVVDINARLIGTETGKILEAASVRVTKGDKLSSLLKPIEKEKPPEVKKVEPLEIHMNIISERKMPDGNYQEILVRQGTTLKSYDHLKVHFETNEDCHVYILLYGSLGEAEQLFPHPKIDMSNRVRGRVEYVVPPEDQWFWLDENIGIETIYVVASYKPMERITKLLADMKGAGDATRSEISKEIKKEIEFVSRGMKKKKKTPKPIHITETAGMKQKIQVVERGIGGITEGKKKTYTLSDGSIIHKVTEVVSGYLSAVKVISFHHE